MTHDPYAFSLADYMIRRGIKVFYQGDLQQAVDIFQRAVEVAELEEDGLAELWAIEWVGVTYGNMGRRDDQFKMAMRLRQRAKELDEPRYQIQGNMRLAEVMGIMDTRRNWASIQEVLTEGIELARQADASYEEIYQMALLSVYAAEVREYDLAREVAWRGLPLIANLTASRRYFGFRFYGVLARIACELEEAEEAVRYARHSVENARASTSPTYAATAEITLGRALALAGQHEEAQSLVEAAIAKGEERGWRPTTLHGYITQTEVLHRAGRYVEAIQAGQKGADLAASLGSNEDEVECLIWIGKSHRALGDSDQARAVWQKAADRAEERGYADYIAISRELLSSPGE